jgi:hypothetical protein
MAPVSALRQLRSSMIALTRLPLCWCGVSIARARIKHIIFLMHALDKQGAA